MRNYLISYVKRFLQLRYHVSVDTLPIDIWFKCHKTGDFSLVSRYTSYYYLTIILALIPLAYINIIFPLLLISLVVVLSKLKLSHIAWSMIYDDYIKTIGLSAEHKEYLNDIKSLALMQCEYVIEPNPGTKTNIEEKILDLKSKTSKTEVDYSVIIARLSRRNGFRIDPKEVTVREFYSYLKDGK